MGLKFRQREAGAGPRLFPNELIFPPKDDESTKILKKKAEVVEKEKPKISKKEQAKKDMKEAVSGAISELISNKPTKSKVREYMRERAKELS